MPEENEKGSFAADIPADAIEEALRAVDRKPAPEVTVEIAPEGADAAPDAGALEQLQAQLDLSQQKGREVLDKLKDEHERYLRASADLDNYKKRAAKEREEVLRFGAEKLVKDLIPVLDNLERALAAAAKDDPLSGGVKLVLKSFEDALARHGVKGFSALGQPFDPRLHEALLQVPTSESPPGTVVMEHGRGFLLNERLVRPAMVGVAVPPEETHG